MNVSLSTLAKQHGFTDVSVTSATLDAPAFKHYEEWVTAGRMGKMTYMHRDVERRRDVRQIMPEAQSVICLTVNYYRPTRESSEEAQGQVARYAYGRDYHKVVEKMLKRLVRDLRDQFPGENFRSYVDTGAVLERAYAEQSGLGRIGKNTTLITPKDGSWVFLCEVIASVSVEDFSVDFREAPSDPCGHCRLCLDICPTGALVSAYELDARKCISYWTIEHRGSIPLEMRPLIADWLYGCDLCQEVCPQNARASVGAIDSISAVKIGGDFQELEVILNLHTEEEFRERFRGSPMVRAKREGLVRNACVVAGNLKARSVLPLLEALSENDESEMVREHAAWAISQMD